MGKIFQIGFNKCGTRTLSHYFRQNGIKSIHYERGRLAKRIWSNHKHGKKLLSGYERYQFFGDMECLRGMIFIFLTLFEKLDEQYPGSKFILNTRDVDKWLRSRSLHPSPRSTKGYLNFFMKHHQKSQPEILQMWRSQWAEHHQKVKNHFRDRPQDLLVFDIEKDSIGKLNKFFFRLKLNKGHYQVQGKKKYNSKQKKNFIKINQFPPVKEDQQNTSE